MMKGEINEIPFDFIYDIEDATQWTVDNWCEIEELVDWSLDKKESKGNGNY